MRNKMVKDKPDVELPEFPFKNKQPFLEGKMIFLWPDAFSQTTGRNGRYVDLGSIRGIRLVNPSPKLLFSSRIVSPLSSHNRFYPGYGWISDDGWLSFEVDDGRLGFLVQMTGVEKIHGLLTAVFSSDSRVRKDDFVSYVLAKGYESSANPFRPGSKAIAGGIIVLAAVAVSYAGLTSYERRFGSFTVLGLPSGLLALWLLLAILIGLFLAAIYLLAGFKGKMKGLHLSK